MPIYDVQGPDGRIYSVEAPEGTPEEQIFGFVRSQMGQIPKPQEGITAALTGGFKRFLSTGETALESIVNPELAAQRGVERAQRLGEQYAPGASLEKVKQAYAERGLFPAVGEAISQIPSALAEQAPQIAATLGSAKLGAMAGTAVAPGVGTIVGGLGGALAPSLMQLYGSNIERQAQEGAQEISRAGALAAAAPGAALEVASTFIPLGRTLVGKLLGPNAEKALARGSNEAIERQAQEALTTSLLKGAGVGAAVEIPTEVTQQMLERLQAGLPLTTEDALKEYGEAAYGAGLVGGPFGAAARGLGRPGVRAQYEQIQQEEAARLAVPEEELAQRFPETLPGGFKIEREEIGREMAPQGYSLTVEGRDEPLSIVDTQEEANAKFESLTKIRQEERENLLKEEQKINADVQKAKDRLERLEATEQTDTDEYRSLKADLPNMMDESAQKIKDLYDRSQSLSKPITVMPFGEVERVNERFKVLGPDAKEIGSFKTLGEAEAEVQGRVGEDVFKQTRQNQQVAKELYKTFVPQMRKFGLGDVGLNIVDRIENGAGGAYLNKLIRVSLEEQNPVQTMRHESLHAMKDLGFFTPQQWKALEERANKQWIKEYLEDQETEVDGQKMSRLEGYKKLGYSQEDIIEEAIADAFGAYDKGAKPPPGMIAALFRKIKNFFAGLGQALRGAGFQSADDIFQQIERGKLKPVKTEAKPVAEEKFSLPIMRGEETPTLEGKPTEKRVKGEKRETTRPEQPVERPGKRGKLSIQRGGDRGGREEVGRLAPLADAPAVEGFHGPDPRIVQVAEQYAKDKGIKLKRQAQYVDVDPDRARRIADEYEKMEHNPQDPKVKAAYEDLVKQTTDQYLALEKAGYKFWFIDLSKPDNLDYLSSPWNAMRDVRANKTMGVFPTNEGFGTDANFSPEANPLLADTGIKWPVGSPNGPLAPVFANDLFRAVHDVFGHGIEGAGFRARGEENAWQAHARLFTGPALGALTSETRGQNSWLNYGPYGEKNQTAKVEDTVFADQKTGLMPEWTWTEGRVEDMPEEERGIVLGTKQPGAIGIKGSHYGNARVDELDASKYGTGLRGAERRRLDQAYDNRIKKRVYFYVKKDDGTTPAPEAGVGPYVYTQKFDNILAPGAEMSRLFREANGDSNDFESGVIDAGYDGYAVPSMGMMVILNHNVPVNYVGPRAEVGIAKLSLKTPTTPEFKRWFGESKVVDADGKPLVVYHGTTSTFKAFNTSPKNEMGAHFGTTTQANQFAMQEQGRIVPVFLSIKNPYESQVDLGSWSDVDVWKEYLINWEANGNGPIDPTEKEIENLKTPNDVRKLIESRGFDGIAYFNQIEGEFDEFGDGRESGNLAYIAFYPNQIKSATGNIGTFEAASPDIRYSLKNVAFPSVKEAKKAVEETKDPDTAEFKQFIGASQWRNEDGSPKRFYHATAAEFFEFTPAGQSQAIFLADTPEEAETFGSIAEDRLRRQIYKALNKDDKLAFFQRVLDKAAQDDKITPKQMEDFIRQAKRKMPEYGDFGDIEQETYDALIDLSPNRMRVMPLYARAETPFDFENPDHVNNVMNWVANNTEYPQDFPEKWLNGLKGRISQGLWQAIEDKRVQAAIRALGHDGFTVRENRASKKNYAVYQPQQVKSITGNLGDFSLETKDVRYSLKNIRYSPERFDKLFSGSMYTQTGSEKKTRGYLGFVDPMAFVRATSSADMVKKLRGEQEPVDFAKMRGLGPIGLQISVDKDGNWKITDHEGRHRMLALNDAGYRDIPIFMEFAGSIDDANSIPTKAIKSQADDTVDRFLRVFDVEPLSYANKDKAMEKFTRMDSKVKYSLPTLSKATMDRIKEVAPGRVNLGWQDRVIGAFKQDFTGLRQRFLNRYETLGVYDRALREKIRKAGGPELLADQSAEFAALQSDLSAGVAASAMGIGDRQGGVPVYRNGFTTIDNSVKGLTEALAPLAKFSGSQKEGEPDIYSTYQFWAGWKRGRRLLREGREQLYTAADEKKAQEIEAAHPEFVQVQKDLIAFNNGIVNYAVQTGVLSRERAQVYTQYADYIPFYRQLELDKTIGPNPFSGISGQKGPKALKGGEGVLGDFLENMVRNTQSMINAGMKNAAAQKATKVALEINQVERLPGPAKGLGVDVYTVLESGQLVYYRANDKLFIDALASLNMPDLPFIGFLSGPANVLRNLVTKDPGFMMANLLRDSLSSYVTSGQKVTPIVGTMVNFGKALAGKDPKLQALFNAGVIGGYEFSQNIEQSGETLSADLNKKAGKDAILLRPFKSLWEGLEKGTTASDAATRMAVYERVMKETGNEAEAISKALEVMNFNRRGNNVLIRIASAALPFFNARLQGLDLFYRASTGQMNATDAAEIKKRFWIRGATMMALSVMYYISVADDEEYEKQEEETKDNNWIFPSAGIRVPIPFEVGTLFKTVPERVTALLMGNDTGKDFRESTYRALVNTFGLNPIPQTFKPLIEVATNYNFFTMRPIVGQGMQEVSPQFQVGPGTSKTAEFIGQKLNLSPLKIDQLIKGYTGTMGGYLVDVIDSITNEFADIPKASKRFEQMPVVKRFALDPEARGSVTQFYELQKSVDTFVRTASLLEKTARPEEYASYVQDNIGLLAVKGYVSSVEKEMKKLRDMKKTINSSDMPSDEKRDLLIDLGRMENSLTSNIKTIKKTVSELK